MNGGYSDAELEKMLADPESELSERKESLKGDAPKGIRRAICAFANDLPDHGRAGVVFVGVDDKGSPVGMRITDRVLQQLADMKSDGQIVPPPTLSVQKRALAGQDVAVVVVHPSDSPPVRYDSRTWVRVGSRRGLATAQDERILNEKRRYRDRHFDAQPVAGANVDDLDLRRFAEDYLPLAVAREVLDANERTTEQQLAALKMIASVDEPTPTVTGLLVLGTRPQDFLPGAYIQFLRIDGTELADPAIDESRCDGSLLQLVDQIEQKLQSHNRTSVDFTSGPREIRRSAYPLEALRQLIRNAVMHRTYEGTNSPVRVCWYDDRIEITSPGGPYGIVTDETFGTPDAVDYRNPNLAEAMRVLGLVQRFGAGIPTARRLLRDNGQPEPYFQVNPNWILCTVREQS